MPTRLPTTSAVGSGIPATGGGAGLSRPKPNSPRFFFSAGAPGGVDHGPHLVAPRLGIPVARGIQRLIGITMPAQVVGDDVKFLGEVALDLAHPR